MRKKLYARRMYILSANDRFNYGDLLFPYILKEYFKDYVRDFVVCSTMPSDMTDRGALKTEGFSCLLRLRKCINNILVVGGGECIFCGWQDILGYVLSDEDLVKIKTKYPTQYPFTIGRKELKNLNYILYNSVGCHQLNERTDLYLNPVNKAILDSADYIAVRDSPTSLGMSRMNVFHYLCADSAILMSKVFSTESLKSKVSSTVSTIQKSKYIFFQMGLVHVKGREKEYAQILKNIAQQTGLNICMCPIGTAIGHDDPQALADIAQFLNAGSFVMVNKPSVWDIMSLIANAEIYVGTSLHGAITAMSYKVPLIVHGPRKLQVYIETWYDTVGSEYSFVSIENLERAVLRRLKSRFIISPEEQMASVEASFMRMKKIIS